MSKKFDVVIGNPPYQEEAQGEGTRDTPIYHLFMDAAYEVGKKAVLITPARFLFNAGFTPEGLEREDARRRAPERGRTTSPTRTICSRARTIKGGIAVTYRDSERKSAPSACSRKHPELNTILHKVVESGSGLHRDVGHHELTLIPLHGQAARGPP